jgi:hypothetical protein
MDGRDRDVLIHLPHQQAQAGGAGGIGAGGARSGARSRVARRAARPGRGGARQLLRGWGSPGPPRRAQRGPPGLQLRWAPHAAAAAAAVHATPQPLARPAAPARAADHPPLRRRGPRARARPAAARPAAGAPVRAEPPRAAPSAAPSTPPHQLQPPPAAAPLHCEARDVPRNVLQLHRDRGAQAALQLRVHAEAFLAQLGQQVGRRHVAEVLVLGRDLGDGAAAAAAAAVRARGTLRRAARGAARRARVAQRAGAGARRGPPRPHLLKDQVHRRARHRCWRPRLCAGGLPRLAGRRAGRARLGSDLGRGSFRQRRHERGMRPRVKRRA